MNNTIDVQVSGGQGIVPATYKTIVLKPNIVNGKNMLTQAMFAQTDTKYVIKYDYTIDDDIVTENVQVLSSNVSQCVNPAYLEAFTAYNEAHDAWIDADNAYTNNPNETTLAAKNAAYDSYTAAQTTLNNTPQYYYYAANAISLHKDQHIIIPNDCILLNNSRNALAGFEVAPVDSIVYIGSLIPGTYEYTIQDAIKIPARSLIEFDGGSISNGTLVCNETILIFDQEEEVILKNVELLGDFEYSAGGSGGVNKKDNVNGMATITLKKNKSFASQLTQTNTIYRIMYDFDLGGESITIPENCLLEFDGGSLINGTVIGSKTRINEDVTYNIFNDCVIKGFELSKVDIRWVGAVGDYNETNNTGTDNAPYFQRAFDNIVLYHQGCPVFICGRYKIASSVTITHNFNMYGVHHNTRFSKDAATAQDSDKLFSPSEIIIGLDNENTPGFNVVGSPRTVLSNNYVESFIDMNISNIKFTGINKNKDIAIKCSLGMYPARPAIIEQCEANHLLYFFEVYAVGLTTFANLTIRNNNIYDCTKAIYTHSNNSVGILVGFCQTRIEDNVIEHNGYRALHLEDSFGSIIINNNLLEGEDNPIYIHQNKRASILYVTIADNYFEKKANNDTKIEIEGPYYENSSNMYLPYQVHVAIKNSHKSPGAICKLSNVIVQELNGMDNYGDSNTMYSTFSKCLFEKNVDVSAIYPLQLKDYNLFVDYPTSRYNRKNGVLYNTGNAISNLGDYMGQNGISDTGHVKEGTTTGNVMVIVRFYDYTGGLRVSGTNFSAPENILKLEHKPYYLVSMFTEKTGDADIVRLRGTLDISEYTAYAYDNLPLWQYPMLTPQISYDSQTKTLTI